MEQRKKIFGALDDLMRSPIGDRLRERVFRELSTKEIHDLLQREQKPYKELMAYYQCALMEVETKFRVLNEQFLFQRRVLRRILQILQESVLSAHLEKIFIFLQIVC